MGMDDTNQNPRAQRAASHLNLSPFYLYVLAQRWTRQKPRMRTSKNFTRFM
jgi:hypothetical protein